MARPKKAPTGDGRIPRFYITELGGKHSLIYYEPHEKKVKRRVVTWDQLANLGVFDTVVDAKREAEKLIRDVRWVSFMPGHWEGRTVG